MNERRDDRIDALVREAAARRENDAEDRVQAQRDRHAVLERLDAGKAPRDASTAGPRHLRSPWWRTTAPFAVAAGLAGLFLLSDRVRTPTAPEPRPGVGAEKTGRGVESSDAPLDVAARSEDTARRSPPPRTLEVSAPPAARVAEEREATSGTTLADTVGAEVDTILARLGPVETPVDLAPAVRDSLVERLRELRPRVTDDERARRTDAWVAPRE